jgi:hypothetical protein
MGEADFTVKLDTSIMDKIIREMPDRVGEFLDQEAEMVVNDIKLSFGDSPSGEVYHRRGLKIHIASVEGYPPNVDTGALRASIEWEEVNDSTREIRDGVEYGEYMEFGTETVAPRPWLGPAMERERRQIKKRARAFRLVNP